MESILQMAGDRDRYWVFDAFARELPGSVDASELAERYTLICQERIAAAPEVGGARASLESLRNAGKQLFVNSATPAGPLTAVVCLRRLEGLFERI